MSRHRQGESAKKQKPGREIDDIQVFIDVRRSYISTKSSSSPGKSDNSNTDGKALQCYLCKELFTSKGSLAQHVRWHVTGSVPEIQQEEDDPEEILPDSDDPEILLENDTKNLDEEILADDDDPEILIEDATKNLDEEILAEGDDPEILIEDVKGNLEEETSDILQTENYPEILLEEDDSEILQDDDYPIALDPDGESGWNNGKTLSNVSNTGQYSKVQGVVKPHRCDICGRSFKERINLHRHFRKHGQKKNRTDRKEFKCNVCGIQFQLSKDLLRHMLMHTSEKPFKCDKCEKAFNQQHLLMYHTKVHKDGSDINK